MHVFTRKPLVEFGERYPDPVAPLDRWYRLVKGPAAFHSFHDFRATVGGTVDQVGALLVFNIGGNKYRLVIEPNYRSQTLYVRDVLTHREYDDNHWKR